MALPTKLSQAIVHLRMLLRATKPITGADTGPWKDAKLTAYLEEGVEYAYKIQREVEEAYYSKSVPITGTGESALPLPSDFEKFHQLHDTADLSNDRRIPYKMIAKEVRDKWDQMAPYGKACWLHGESAIGVLPVVAESATVTLTYTAGPRYWAESAPPADYTDTNLTRLGKRVALYYAAWTAFADQRDPRADLMKEKLATWEEMMRDDDREADYPVDLDIRETPLDNGLDFKFS